MQLRLRTVFRRTGENKAARTDRPSLPNGIISGMGPEYTFFFAVFWLLFGRRSGAVCANVADRADVVIWQAAQRRTL